MRRRRGGARAVAVALDRRFALEHGREIRLAAELGLETMAAALGVSVPTLSRWERGAVRCPDHKASAWAGLLRELAEARREAVA